MKDLLYKESNTKDNLDGLLKTENILVSYWVQLLTEDDLQVFYLLSINERSHTGLSQTEVFLNSYINGFL